MTTTDVPLQGTGGAHPGSAPNGDVADVLRPAKPPVGTGSSPLFAQLIALAFIGLGVVGVQALLVSLDLVSGQAWISSVVDAADGISGSSVLVLVVGIVSVVLGVLLLPVVFRRRPRTGVALHADTGVYLRRRDLSDVLEAALDGTDAVTDIRVRTTRRKVRVDATSVAGKDRDSEIRDAIGVRLAPAMDALARPLRLGVTVRNDGS